MADRASLAPLTKADAAGREQSAVVTERAGPNEEAGPRHGVQRRRSRGAPLAKDQSDGAGEGGVSREAPAEDDNPPRLKDGPTRTAVDDDLLRLSDGNTPPVVDDDPLRLAGGPAGPVIDGGPPRLADTHVWPVVYDEPPGLVDGPVRSARTNLPVSGCRWKTTGSGMESWMLASDKMVR